MKFEEVSVDAHSQKGARRESNQDSIGALGWINNQNISDTFAANFTETILPKLFLLADGVGGHAHGAFASRKTIQIIVELFDRSAEDFNILNGILAAHAELVVKPQNLNCQMATTIVGLVLCQNRALIFNVGDSRAYLISNKKINLLSIDDNDETKPKNIITQCIGGVTKTPKPHFLSLKYEKKDTFILLSDGVTDWLSETKIFEILSSNENEKSSLLCREAVRAGSEDDVSALIVKRLI
ncbi:MAG: hypothetical protein CMF71_06230 [Magnetovibrio sp.]|nr:hypothetical protein [Magnetovibrio sp.]MBH89803.1 hypothetical protein [Magnetovibrio sp.]|tara:strand:+ start:3986 stop:4705 length:720 start_codon:yes stop_codon:yes gene_type:complete